MDTMDPTPQQISAMADELSALAKSLETKSDPREVKHTKAAVVLQAKELISQVQDPMDAVMDHVTNVRLLLLRRGLGMEITDIFIQIFVVSALRALMEIGVFEAIPPTGSIGITELAEKCEADESLISIYHLFAVTANMMLTIHSSTNEAAHVWWHLHRAEAEPMVT